MEEFARFYCVFVIEIGQFGFGKDVSEAGDLGIFGGTCNHGTTQSASVRSVTNFYVLTVGNRNCGREYHPNQKPYFYNSSHFIQTYAKITNMPCQYV